MRSAKLALAAALALGLSSSAFAQGSTIGGPSAAGAPQPPVSDPDKAKMGADKKPMAEPSKEKKKPMTQSGQ
jgi:hypothetical protein